MTLDSNTQFAAFVLGKVPDELTLEEIGQIRQALIDSPELRADLLCDPECSEFLEDAFARVGMSVESLVPESSTTETDLQPWTQIGFVLPTLMLMLAALIYLIPRRSDRIEPDTVIIQRASESNHVDVAESTGAVSVDRPEREQAGEADVATNPPPKPGTKAAPTSNPKSLSQNISPRENDAARVRAERVDAIKARVKHEQRPSNKAVLTQLEEYLQAVGDLPHPLLLDVSKEGFNLSNEFRLALQSDGFCDACRMISSFRFDVVIGMLADAADPDLYMSLQSLIALAMRERPGLRKSMQEEFGDVARLRLSRAIDDADIATVRAARTNFLGTDAVPAAHLWLGDVQVARGEFAQAVNEYQNALAHANGILQRTINARLRLAGAMLGCDLGQRVESAANWGDSVVSAAVFEAMISELIAIHRFDDTGSTTFAVGGLTASDIGTAPHPIRFQARDWSQVPNGSRGWNQRKGGDMETDWAGRCVSVAESNGLMLVSNRMELTALDLNSGRQRWTQTFGGTRGYPPTWYWSPMRPLIVGNRIFVRRLPRGYPDLNCLDASRGKIVWRSNLMGMVASDPWLHAGKLIALTVTVEPKIGEELSRRRARVRSPKPNRTGIPDILRISLTAFDPDTGRVLDQSPLARFRDAWDGMIPCRAVAKHGQVIASVGGAVVASDLDGNVQWIRRQWWRPPQENLMRVGEYFSLPAVADGRVFVTQPNVGYVECLSAESGRLLWRHRDPQLLRIFGCHQQRLIVQRADGFAALDPQSGDVLWRRPDDRILEGFSCGPDGEFVYTRNEQLSSGQWQPELVWLDPRTGNETHRSPLASLASTGRRPIEPLFGPLADVDGRLFAFFDSRVKSRSTVRRVVELGPAKK